MNNHRPSNFHLRERWHQKLLFLKQAIGSNHPYKFHQDAKVKCLEFGKLRTIVLLPQDSIDGIDLNILIINLAEFCRFRLLEKAAGTTESSIVKKPGKSIEKFDFALINTIKL